MHQRIPTTPNPERTHTQTHKEPSRLIKSVHPAFSLLRNLQVIAESAVPFRPTLFRPRCTYPSSIHSDPAVASADAASAKLVHGFLEPIVRDIQSITFSEHKATQLEGISSSTMQLETLAVDPMEGLVFVTESRQASVYIFDSELNPVDVLTKSADQFNWLDPRGIAISHDGARLAVCDFSGNGVFIIDRFSKALIQRIGSPNNEKGVDPGLLNGPLSCVFDLTGCLYVAETGNNRIQKFGADGKHQLFISTYGQEEEQTAVCSVALLDDEVLVSSGESGGRIQFHALDGRLLRDVSGPGNPQGFMLPENCLCRGPDGGFVLADVWHDKVFFYDKHGTLELEITCPYPVGVAFDRRGDLLVVLSRMCAIQRL